MKEKGEETKDRGNRSLNLDPTLVYGNRVLSVYVSKKKIIKYLHQLSIK